MRTRTHQRTPSKSRTRTRPRLASTATAVLLGALTLALAACGQGDDGGGSQVASLGNTATTASDASAADGAASDGADGETSTTVDPEDAFLAFARCMREHGVDMPDPQVDDNGRGVIQVGGPGGDGEAQPIDKDTLDAAQQACQPLIDDVVQARQQDLDPEQVQQMQDQALAFSQCMRDHGIDFPDPVFGDGGTVSISLGDPGGGGIDPQSQEFQDAQAECGRTVGGPIGGGPGGGSTQSAGGGGAGSGPVTNINVAPSGDSK